MPVKKAIEIIEPMSGVLKVVELSPEDKLKIVDLESEHENEIIPIENEGVKQCLIRDNCIAIFKTKDFRLPPSPTVLLTTEDGTVLGKEIFTDEEKEEYRQNENSLFLSEEFVLFDKNMGSKRKPGSKEIFILPPVDFPELEDIEGATAVVSSSPSTKSDDYLKEKYGFEADPKIASILVGFSIKKD